MDIAIRAEASADGDGMHQEGEGKAGEGNGEGIGIVRGMREGLFSSFGILISLYLAVCLFCMAHHHSYCVCFTVLMFFYSIFSQGKVERSPVMAMVWSISAFVKSPPASSI